MGDIKAYRRLNKSFNIYTEKIKRLEAKLATKGKLTELEQERLNRYRTEAKIMAQFI
ncbi:MAG: hypothetical protein WC437_04945 [Patescibacteria group bacterium]